MADSTIADRRKVRDLVETLATHPFRTERGKGWGTQTIQYTCVLEGEFKGPHLACCTPAILILTARLSARPLRKNRKERGTRTPGRELRLLLL